MNRVRWMGSAVLLLAVALGGTAWAHGRAYVGVGVGVGGAWVGPVPGGYYGPRVYYGGGAWPYYRPYYRPYAFPYAYPYGGYAYGAYPYAYAYPPAVVTVPSSPPVYVEQSQPPSVPAEAPTAQVNWWYWCAEAQGYYPHVRQCPGVWQRVPPQPPPASATAPGSPLAPMPAPGPQAPGSGPAQ